MPVAIVADFARPAPPVGERASAAADPRFTNCSEIQVIATDRQPWHA
jgi:hypothetical protein